MTRLAWLIVVFVSILLLATTGLAVAQETVYLPYVYGTSISTLDADSENWDSTVLLPEPEVAKPVSSESLAASSESLETVLPTTESEEVHSQSVPDIVTLEPMPQAGSEAISPESRMQDTDGVYALPSDVYAAGIASFSQPGTFTVGGNLGVGTEAPAFKGDIVYNANGVARLRVQNTNTGGNAWADVAITTGPGKGYAIQKFGANFNQFTWSGLSLADWARFRSDSGVKGLIFTTGGAAPLVFGTSDQERMRITSEGDIEVGDVIESVYGLPVNWGPAVTISDSSVGVGARLARTFSGRPFEYLGPAIFMQGTGGTGRIAINTDLPPYTSFDDLVLMAVAGNFNPMYLYPQGIGINVRMATVGLEINNVVNGIVVDSPYGAGIKISNPGQGNGLLPDGVFVENGDVRVNGGSLIGDRVQIENPREDGLYVTNPTRNGASVYEPGRVGYYAQDPGIAGLEVAFSTNTGKDGVLVHNGNIRVSGGSFIDDGTTLSVPDYVFADDYPLMSLDQLRAFINDNKHLPNVPSEADVKANGVDLSAFNMVLLEKVEEQALYILQLEQSLNQVEIQLAELRILLEMNMLK